MKTPKDFTLLVVDDEETLRDSISFDFKRKGFTVLSAENGAIGFELVKNNNIDIVISDMRMPGGDGMSLLQKIRAHNPDIPNLIFVSGFSDFSEAECLAKGARKVFSKPFDRKALMNSVLEILEIIPTT
ncbi:MAG: response regulator [Bdellovibrionota bacterium]